MSLRMAVVGLFVVSGVSRAIAAGGIQDLARDWKASDWRRLGIASTSASSTFGAGPEYAPARAIDGHRGSKWVAADKPSPAHPQWLRLDLFGRQEVAAVAVFGETINNDGIQDAQIQVAGAPPGEFTTVATIQGATSPSWLATFAPVKTTAVRLLVTRSGGPSTHTDVYEVEVLGRPLPPAELQGYATDRLRSCADRWQELADVVKKLGPQADSSGLGWAATSAALDNHRRQLAERLAQWGALGEPDRQTLVSQLERLEVRLQRLTSGLPGAAAAWPQRARELAAARAAASLAAATEQVVATREGTRLRLTNKRVSAVLDESEGAWDAIWLEGAQAAVRRVSFGLEVGRQPLSLPAAKSAAQPFTDSLGAGLEIRQRWSAAGVEVERGLRMYHGRPEVVVVAHITNRSDRELTLGEVRMLELSESRNGWWQLSGVLQAPAAVGFSDASPPCRPAPDEEPAAGPEIHYGSSGVLTLAPRNESGGLTLGFLSALGGAPSVGARFRTCSGGTALSANLALGGRVLPAGQTLTLDPVWLSVEEHGHDALEHYGDAVAKLAPPPVRTGANALWCSWYPLRMQITEEIVLAQAKIAAEHFQPLGLNLIQLDHGWQRGDVCGDWVPNERFPHGIKWLAEQLRSRHGMKLGLWIAPTQVAVNSQLFRDHPEWMLRGNDGRPARTGQWFWVPNPEMTMLNAGHPAAEKWIEETFARLTAEGASYYKIDFIAGSPALRRAMEAIRRGAGPESWIRYCQTPPLLSVGLASSAYIGDDTGDAGLRDWLRLERINAPLLAASYWANDRLYHREVCDMSVGPAASLEEARFRLTLMTLAGCSISFSDDFRTLTPPRIRLMQQCLPPGNPPARPLDLFERELPSLWHMHCRPGVGEWDAIGAFNFEEQPQERTISWAALGLPAGTETVAFEFWEERLLGVYRDRLTLRLPPQTARIVLLRRVPQRPEVIATNLHVLGGYHELKQLTWDEKQLVLSGRYQRAAGLAGKAYLYVPAGFLPRLDPTAKPDAQPLQAAGPNLWVQDLKFRGRDLDWTLAFQRAQPK